MSTTMRKPSFLYICSQKIIIFIIKTSPLIVLKEIRKSLKVPTPTKEVKKLGKQKKSMSLSGKTIKFIDTKTIQIFTKKSGSIL